MFTARATCLRGGSFFWAAERYARFAHDTAAGPAGDRARRFFVTRRRAWTQSIAPPGTSGWTRGARMAAPPSRWGRAGARPAPNSGSLPWSRQINEPGPDAPEGGPGSASGRWTAQQGQAG